MMNRFFVSDSCIAGERVELVGPQARQICRVLRLSVGARIIVLDNTGAEYDVVLTAVALEKVEGHLTQKRLSAGEPTVRITLYQSLLARQKFEYVLQKCTEVGVARFVPIVTERSIIRKAGKVTPSRLTRWRSIITEAAEQAGRGKIPELAEPVDFAKALSQPADYDLRLIAWPAAKGPTLRELLGTNAAHITDIALFIGPEGDFTDDEVRLAQDNGASALCLGPRILRTETAGVVIAAIILHELGQMQ